MFSVPSRFRDVLIHPSRYRSHPDSNDRCFRCPSDYGRISQTGHIKGQAAEVIANVGLLFAISEERVDHQSDGHESCPTDWRSKVFRNFKLEYRDVTHFCRDLAWPGVTQLLILSPDKVVVGRVSQHS